MKKEIETAIRVRLAVLREAEVVARRVDARAADSFATRVTELEWVLEQAKDGE